MSDASRALGTEKSKTAREFRILVLMSYLAYGI